MFAELTCLSKCGLKRWARTAFAVALCGLGAAACETSSLGFAGYDVPSSPPQSALSDYLAAQHARYDNATELAADYYLAALSQNPANAPTLRDRAYKLLISDGRFSEAADLAPSLSRGSLSFNLSKMVAVLETMKAKRYKQALLRLDSVNGTGFDLLLKPITRAWAHAGRKEREEAFKALEALKTQRAFGGFYLEQKAYLEAYFGDWEQAKGTFSAALQEGRQLSSRGILDYAARLSRRDEFDTAVEAVDTVLSRAPRIAELVSARQQLLAGRAFRPYVNRPADAVAEALYRTSTELVRKPTATSAIVYARLATLLQPDLTAAYILIGDVYAAQSRFRQASATLADVDETGPLSTILISRKAAFFEQLDRTDDAIAVLEQALEREPGNTLLQSELAELQRIHEQFDQSIALYDQVIAATDPPDWRLYYGRGIAHEQSGDFMNAEPDLRKALSLRPGDALILNYLGYSLLDRGLKVDEAVAMIDDAVAARPNDGYIVDSQGWAAYLRGDYEKAVELLERAVALVPGDPTINDHLGDAYWKAGRYIEARFKWRQVLTMEPSTTQEVRIAQKIDLGLTLADSVRTGAPVTR